MFGEMRSPDSAQIGIQAAQTGHLVLSTVHTNSAAETITRLVNMGIPQYQIASSLTLIIAQRLVRRLCEHCKQPDLLSIDYLKQLDIPIIHKRQSFLNPWGVNNAREAIKGELGFLKCSCASEITESILQGKSATYIHNQATEYGMLT